MITLRVNDVAAKVTVSVPTIWNWVKAGEFPKAFSIGANVTVWDEADIDNWLTSKKESQNGSSREAAHEGS